MRKVFLEVVKIDHDPCSLLTESIGSPITIQKLQKRAPSLTEYVFFTEIIEMKILPAII